MTIGDGRFTLFYLPHTDILWEHYFQQHIHLNNYLLTLAEAKDNKVNKNNHKCQDCLQRLWMKKLLVLKNQTLTWVFLVSLFLGYSHRKKSMILHLHSTKNLVYLFLSLQICSPFFPGRGCPTRTVSQSLGGRRGLEFCSPQKCCAMPLPPPRRALWPGLHSARSANASQWQNALRG